MQRLKKDDSLVAIVKNEIAECDNQLADRFSRSFRAQPNNQYDEIIELNSFWRRELSALTVNTISERECLIDMIDPSSWLRHFRNQVLPTIVRFKLPRAATA